MSDHSAGLYVTALVADAEEDAMDSNPEGGEAVSDLISSFNQLMKNSNCIHPDLEQHRGLTAAAFLSLMAHFTSYSQQLEAFKRSDSKKDSTRLNSIIDELKSKILPSVRHRITSLSIALDPSDIHKDPVGKLELVLKVIFELKQNLDQLQILFNSDPPQNLARSVTTKNLTVFKSDKLIWMLTDIIKEIHRLLYFSHKLIRDLDLSNHAVQQRSSQNINPSSTSVPDTRRRVIRHTAYSWELIDTLMEWLKQSDFSLVQNELQAEVDILEDALSELLELLRYESKPKSVTGIGPDGEDELVVQDDFELYSHSQPTEQTTKMGNLMVPIIKLSRLFLNKLSKTKANKELATMLSKMDPSQLCSLLGLAGSISCEIDGMINSLDYYAQGEEEDIDDSLFDTTSAQIDSLRDRFGSALEVLFPHLESFPLNQFDDKTHPKIWFQTWNNQFILANEALKLAARQFK